MNRRQQGSAWEEKAESWLKRRGLTPLERNVHFRGGELDLIMRDGDCLVFVEVRSRDRNNSVTAVESIGWQKRQRLWRAAQLYLARHPQLAAHPCRFDVVAITTGGWRAKIDWIQDALRADQ